MPDFSPILPLTASEPSSPPHCAAAKATSPNPLLPLYNLAANLKSPIPAKFKKAKPPSLRLQRVKSKGEATQDITKLQTSFEIAPSLKQLRNRKWTLWDLQHVATFGCLLLCLCITPSAPFVKTAAMGLLALLLLMPVTRQFFLPSLPIWVYLFYFFASRFIAPEYRPHIWVKVLPALENVLYGANLSNILSSHTYTILDIIAWIPYGLGHFVLPLVTTVMLFLFAAPGTTPVWARAFGYMSILGVTIQIIFPCTPPWYEGQHGFEPAHYGMQGNPAGLKRIDELFGVDMYTTSFTTAPVPFGAFPSLHGGDAVLEALFLQYCFPRFRPFFVGYVIWIAWSTMYLNHHYAIDLVGGGIIAAITYYIARTRWLPRPQLDKTTRWEYEYVEFGDRPRVALDEEYGGLGFGLLQRRGSDEWTLGRSSSFDSMSRGDTLCGSSSSSPNILSPTTPNDDHHVDLWSKVKTSPRALGEEEQREVYVR